MGDLGGGGGTDFLRIFLENDGVSMELLRILLKRNTLIFPTSI